MIKEKITLAELKRKTSQIISELQENNERFEKLHNNEGLTLKQYESRWGRLFQKKIELQKELDDLHTRLLINWVWPKVAVEKLENKETKEVIECRP